MMINNHRRAMPLRNADLCATCRYYVDTSIVGLTLRTTASMSLRGFHLASSISATGQTSFTEEPLAVSRS